MDFYNPLPLQSDTTSPVFCQIDNASLNDLEVISQNGGSITWYASENGDDILDTTIALEDGITYFAQEEISGNCPYPIRLGITPSIISVAPAVLSASNFNDCNIDNPTVAELFSLETNINQNIIWYDIAEGGIPLNQTDLLINGITYYAESYDNITQCSTNTRVPVTINLNQCNPEEYDFFIPDGFSPNGDGRNDVFNIPNIENIFPDFTIEIINRYGTTIFKGNRNNPFWNGNYKNTPSPNGVYFYIINYNREGYKPLQGRLYLNR